MQYESKNKEYEKYIKKREMELIKELNEQKTKNEQLLSIIDGMNKMKKSLEENNKINLDKLNNELLNKNKEFNELQNINKELEIKILEKNEQIKINEILLNEKENKIDEINEKYNIIQNESQIKDIETAKIKNENKKLKEENYELNKNNQLINGEIRKLFYFSENKAEKKEKK